MDNSRYIRELDLAVADNGLAIRIDLGTFDGEQKQFFSNIETIQQLVSALLGASQQAANNMSQADLESFFPKDGETVTIHPIDVAKFRIAEGRIKDEIILDLHLGAIHFSFCASRSQAENLIEQIQTVLA